VVGTGSAYLTTFFSSINFGEENFHHSGTDFLGVIGRFNVHGGTAMAPLIPQHAMQPFIESMSLTKVGYFSREVSECYFGPIFSRSHLFPTAYHIHETCDRSNNEKEFKNSEFVVIYWNIKSMTSI
jgi:hypothetical protein